ncbi:hypothetical protein GCM10009634_74880 [Saccharothrix xinjiangensis]
MTQLDQPGGGQEVGTRAIRAGDGLEQGQPVFVIQGFYVVDARAVLDQRSQWVAAGGHHQTGRATVQQWCHLPAVVNVVEQHHQRPVGGQRAEKRGAVLRIGGQRVLRHAQREQKPHQNRVRVTGLSRAAGVEPDIQHPVREPFTDVEHPPHS